MDLPRLWLGISAISATVPPLLDSGAPGRLAQLGERQLDKLEVTGSSPVAPIAPLTAGSFAWIRSLTESPQDAWGGVAVSSSMKS